MGLNYCQIASAIGPKDKKEGRARIAAAARGRDSLSANCRVGVSVFANTAQLNVVRPLAGCVS